MTINDQPDVYIDTDTVVNATIRGLRHTEACRRAFEQLLASESMIHFSVILRMEYVQALRNLATRTQLTSSLRHEFELDNWNDYAVRQRWMQFGLAQLESFLAELPTVIELPLSSSLVEQAVSYMARYSLRSQDAVHLATAIHYQIPVFWTCDDHFNRVDDLSVEVIRNHG